MVYEGDASVLEGVLASEGQGQGYGSSARDGGSKIKYEDGDGKVDGVGAVGGGDGDANGDEEDDDEEEDEDEEDGDPAPKSHAVKLIDFAHSSWTPGQGPDEHMLEGVRNVAAVLEKLLAELEGEREGLANA